LILRQDALDFALGAGALAEVHASVDGRDSVRESHGFQTMPKPGERVAVLGEDDELFVLELRIGKDLAELLEFRFDAGLHDRAREIRHLHV